MNTIVFTVYFILLTLGSNAFANCKMGEEVDLRYTRGEIFRDIKIKNQEKYGICYAHAAATLIDFHRKLKKSDRYDSRSTDPIGAAAFSTAASGDGSVEGGHICEVIQAQVQAGVGCGFSGVSFQLIKGLGDVTQSAAVKAFMPYVLKQKVFKPVDPSLFPKMARTLHKKSIDEDQKAFLERFDEYLKVLETELSLRSFPRNVFPSDEKIFALLQSIHSENRWASYQGEIEYLAMRASCDEYSYKMPALRCAEYDRNQVDLIEIIDDDLRKNLPTGAAICGSFLANKNFVGLRNNGTMVSGCEPHAVVVIGKRATNTGQCQYLIRNSWGTNAQYAWPTSSGDIWVDESALKMNIYQAQVVR